MKMVVVNKIGEALEVLVKKSTDFANRLIKPSVEMFTDGCRDIGFSNYSPTWKLHRKLSAKALRYSFEEVNYILKQADRRITEFNSGTLEDVLPPIRHVYKSRGFRKMEDFFHTLIVDFIGKKYHAEKETFKRAGLDTSRLTLQFELLHVAAYPDIQAKAQEEIDRVVGHDRLPGINDRPDLAYTEAVLHESMRISTVVPSGLWHETLCDTSIGSYKIPKGTPVMINHWALHNDPDAWDQVEKFKPERYLDEHGKLGPKPRSWLPFGAGKRVCLGEFVAKSNLHLIFASLLQRYRWSPEPGHHVDISPERSLFLNFPKAQKLRIERRI
ncbi:CP17A-like protein [Mya arenaria]|uniref:CP17A-like protein n=1 Tax=Mya arenaria TaxID=6604 RepID=A0ABY7ET79_MYAAR|nr:CP17A-like protein [Mya arenaria]